MAAIDMGGTRGSRRGGIGGRRSTDQAGTIEAVISVVAMVVAGALAGGAVFLVSRMLTDMAPTLAAIGGAAVYFALAHHLIHSRRRINGMRLLVVHFFTVWALLFAVGIAALVGAAHQGQQVGAMLGALLFGPPVLSGLLTALPGLAAGDRPPSETP